MPKLTPAQERYLAEIRESGEKTYNGRAYRNLVALEDAGLIKVEWFVVRGDAERHTARPL